VSEGRGTQVQRPRHWKSLEMDSKAIRKIMFYGQSLVVIAQHHPEYVSLAWGTIKFLLVVSETTTRRCHRLGVFPLITWKRGVLNHESLVKELCKALSRVANTLGHVQLNLLLHPNEAMREKASALYLHIIEFVTRATQCYQKRRATRALLVLSSPFQLKFRNIVDDFLDTSRFVDRLALSLSQVEVRQMRIEHSSLSSSQLQKWGALIESSQILIHGSFRNRHLARDFTTDMMDVISDAGVPVVWALNSSRDAPTPLASIDVLKSITLQVLRLNHTMLNERSASLNAARFQSTITEAGCFSLLGAALEGLQQLYIVLDLELLDKIKTSCCHTWLQEFPRLFKSLSTRNIHTLLKVAFVSPLGRKQYPPDQTLGNSVIKLTPNHQAYESVLWGMGNLRARTGARQVSSGISERTEQGGKGLRGFNNERENLGSMIIQSEVYMHLLPF
ncbi:hypothetical protein B0T10DRAFT_418954, partial [Thelonectria olida]